jgi:hypothetical protein
LPPPGVLRQRQLVAGAVQDGLIAERESGNKKGAAAPFLLAL